MKKLIALILTAVMLTFVLASCASYKTVDKIKEAGTLTVFTEAGFAPYEFVYENEVVGVDVSIMKAVADKLGVKLEVKDVSFDTICAAVNSGKTDVGAAAITIRADRQKQVDFSNPYSSTEQYIIVPKDNDSIKTLEDLKGLKIGVQQGTTSDFMISDFIADGTLAGCEVVGYEAPAVAAASIDKLGAVVTDKLTAQIICNNNAALKAFKLVKADGSDVAEIEEYGIAVAKGNETLLAVINETLAELMADGTIDKWVEDFTALANSIEEAE